VPYFHVVFTIPDTLNVVVMRNKRVLYGVLFRAASETLREVAANPRRLGAELGFVAILHTWSQTLVSHPHLHVVIPGGGLSPDRSRWVPCRRGFFLPVRVLSKVFRGKFLSGVEHAFQENRLRFSGKISHLAEPVRFKHLLRQAACVPWVVYAKEPFAGPAQALDYLGRYTHRVAISNERLVKMEDGRVTFRWRDRASGNALRAMTLDAAEFLRRFLLHVLPRGFVRIRHYGFLSNRRRRASVALCRRLVSQIEGQGPSEEPTEPDREETWQEILLRLTGIDVTICPRCGEGRMVECEVLLPRRLSLGPVERIDSS